MVEMPTRSALATTPKSTLRKSSTKSSTSQPRFFIIVPRMSVPRRGSGNWEKMWRPGAFGSMKTILAIARLLGGLPALPVPGLESENVFSLFLEQVLPALDALFEELHLVEERLDGREHGREPLVDLGLRERVRIGLDGDEGPDLVRDGLDLLERVAEELEVADELAEEDVGFR